MTNHPNRRERIDRNCRCYEAHGRVLLADGWSPVGTRFTVLVPSRDAGRALEYAKSWRKGGIDGLATRGCEDIISVSEVDPRGRRPRNEDRGGLGALPVAPDGSFWSLEAALWDGVLLRCTAARSFEQMEKRARFITWHDLQDAAAGHPYYAEVHRRGRIAAMFGSN